MVTIKVTKGCIVRGDACFVPGEQLDVEEAEANSLVSRGYAEICDVDVIPEESGVTEAESVEAEKPAEAEKPVEEKKKGKK